MKYKIPLRLNRMKPNKMIFGKQRHYCPNCGLLLYDCAVSTHGVSLCTPRCREEWQKKYVAMIQGKNAEPPTKVDYAVNMDR